jgi:signal peptidase I
MENDHNVARVSLNMNDFNKQFREQFQKQFQEEKEIPKSMSHDSESPGSSQPSDEKKRKQRIRSKFFSGIRDGDKKKGKGRGGYHFFLLVLIGLINVLVIVSIVVLVRTFLVSPFAVDGSSMSSNLSNGDLILVDKVTYRFSEPKRGDVVVFYPPVNQVTEQKGFLCRAKKVGYALFGKDIQDICMVRAFYVKRVIGIPGDTVEVRNGKVFVTPIDGERTEIREDFLDEKNQGNTCLSSSCHGTKDVGGIFIEVPKNALYVLGDNRRNSTDSRAWKNTPFVRYEDVSGKVRMIFAPLSNISFLPKIDILSSAEDKRE